jgi:hypothetical protein
MTTLTHGSGMVSGARSIIMRAAKELLHLHG